MAGGKTFQIRGSPVAYKCILICLVSTMGGFLFGYDTGQISGIQEMEDFVARFGTETNAQGEPAFNEWLIGVLVSMLSIGTAIGALLGAIIADKLGRKKAIFVECLVFDVGVIIQVVSFDAWYQVGIGRLVTGLGVGALSAAIPVYQSEVLPRQVRGAMVAAYQFMITLGILVAAVINIGTREIDNSASWRVPIALGIFFALILNIGILFCPESPRWLVTQERPDDAYKSMAVVRGATKEGSNAWVEAEYKELISFHEEDQKRGAAGWAECFLAEKRIRYRTFLGIALQAGQQLTGANYYFYFGTTIFSSVQLQDSFVTAIILGAVNVFCTIIGLYVLERFGRRLPLIFGAAWMTAWLIVFGLAGHFGGDGNGSVDDTGIGRLLIVSASMFILGYASTWAPGIWLFCGESFSRRTRAKQASLATTSNWIWNFLIAFFSRSIADSIGFLYGLVFAGANLLNFIIAFLFVFETTDLTLEQIDQMYGDYSCKAWHSRQWVPAGFSSRQQLSAAGNKSEKDSAESMNASEERDGQWSPKPDPVTDDKARENVTKTESA